MSEKAYMDTIITETPKDGGMMVFTNHEEVKTTDPITGEEQISYVADAEWVPGITE